MTFPVNPFNLLKGVRSFVTPYIQPLFFPFIYLFLSSIGTIFSIWTNGDRFQDQHEYPNPLNATPYDFIIVGAGSSGCLLAKRLSANYNVLLFEAGGEPNPFQFVPGISYLVPNLPEVDWQHKTVPQKHASQISVNEKAAFSAGLGLGGSGNINYMIHLRGHKKDYDNWAKITGDSSWSWEGVLPHFKNYENYAKPGDNENHGYNGELHIEKADFPPSAKHFVRAGGELGYPHVDLNAPFQEGFDFLRYSMKSGMRQAPYKAFLEPIRKRNTLTIMKFSHVNKILYKEGNVASGVEYDRHGRTYQALARREVIICAGAVNTPKLLMLSGIGPKSHLSDLNIPIKADLSVGENLQDHLAVFLGPFFIRSGMGYYMERDLTIGQFIRYSAQGRGVLSSTLAEATGILSSSHAKNRGEGDWPDIQLIQYGFTNYRTGTAALSRVYNLKFDEIDRYHREGLGKDSVFILVSVARPYSRGYVKLGGSSAYDKPIINPNYFSDPEGTDMKVMLEAVKKAVFLMENTTAAGVDMGASFTSVSFPGCEHLTFRSDDYWRCYIKRYSMSQRDAVGTAAMGNVVDTQLRVMGIKNLRIIDASVEPVLVSTPAQAGALMIAEKGADMILKYWSGQDLVDNNMSVENPFSDVFEDRNDTEYHQERKRSKGKKKASRKSYDVDSEERISPFGIPTKNKIFSGSSVIDEETKAKLFKSFDDLKKMSDLVREQYSNLFIKLNYRSTTPSPKKAKATTTTYRTTTKTTTTSTTTATPPTELPQYNKHSKRIWGVNEVVKQLGNFRHNAHGHSSHEEDKSTEEEEDDDDYEDEHERKQGHGGKTTSTSTTTTTTAEPPKRHRNNKKGGNLKRIKSYLHGDVDVVDVTPPVTDTAAGSGGRIGRGAFIETKDFWDLDNEIHHRHDGNPLFYNHASFETLSSPHDDIFKDFKV